MVVEVVVKIILGGESVIFVAEINFGVLAPDFASFSIIGAGCFLSSVESDKPSTNSFSGVANLCCPFAPWSLRYASVQVFSLPLRLLLHLLITCFKTKFNNQESEVNERL